MAYTILWNRIAQDSIKKLERNISERIIEKLDSVKENPHQFLETLTGTKFYKIRVGDYRAIVDVDHSNQKILVRLVDHRKRIYKILWRMLY